MDKKKNKSSNQRANIKNPNNIDFKKSLDNRSNQKNPNNDKFYKSRDKSKQKIK
jgi:hypothetical protein